MAVRKQEGRVLREACEVGEPEIAVAAGGQIAIDPAHQRLPAELEMVPALARSGLDELQLRLRLRKL